MADEARYSVGIDLGTTNSAMACADLTAEDATAIEILGIPQLVNVGEVSERSLLPSFLYIAGEFDFPADGLRLPWPDDAARRVVGELARKRGSENPSRLVTSAKSWLSIRRGEPHVADSALGRARGGAETLAGCRIGALPPASPAGVGRSLCGGTARARARTPGHAHHRPRLVRRRGARADAAGRRRGRTSRA